MSKVFWCKNCLNMSTRPRTKFDERGWCGGCQWMEEKNTVDWQARQEEMKQIVKKYRRKDSFDCIVPVSGGKDGTYVVHSLKNKYNMHPLAVTVRPCLELELGKKNLENFVQSGVNHIHITPNAEVMRQINKLGFIEKGFPYYGWLITISTSVIRVAMNFDIPLIFYGEEGDVEYGGSTELKNTPMFNIEYMKRVYLERGHDKIMKMVDAKPADLYLFQFPTEEEVEEKELYLTHLGYFEPWDSYRNYLVAKEHFALQENEEANTGTFTNYAQNDQALYALHTYLMYLKFGFGRATQDSGIEIRRGSMTREQAKSLVPIYDNQYPESFIDLYLEHYDMTIEEFDAVLDKFVNRELFEKKNGRWMPTFTIE